MVMVAVLIWVLQLSQEPKMEEQLLHILALFLHLINSYHRLEMILEAGVILMHNSNNNSLLSTHQRIRIKVEAFKVRANLEEEAEEEEILTSNHHLINLSFMVIIQSNFKIHRNFKVDLQLEAGHHQLFRPLIHHKCKEVFKAILIEEDFKLIILEVECKLVKAEEILVDFNKNFQTILIPPIVVSTTLILIVVQEEVIKVNTIMVTNQKVSFHQAQDIHLILKITLKTKSKIQMLKYIFQAKQKTQKNS